MYYNKVKILIFERKTNMGNKEKKEKKQKKKYEKGNKKIDNISEAIDLTLEAGRKVDKKSKAFWADFKKFVAKGNVVDLAIAVVVGSAFNKIVSALVSEIITPLTSLVLKENTLKELKWVLKPAIEANEELGIEAVPEVAVTYGVFLQTVLDFLVVALSIYFALKIILKLKNTIRRKEIAAAEKKAKEEAARKKAEADVAAAKAAAERQKFIDDVAIQGELLADIKAIMLRMEQKNK